MDSLLVQVWVESYPCKAGKGQGVRTLRSMLKQIVTKCSKAIEDHIGVKTISKFSMFEYHQTYFLI